MKKLSYLIVLALILGLVLSGCLLSNVGQVPTTSQTKVKPEGLGAQTYAWYLSGAVMPVPPYGLKDEPGSDTASKLIVNQPNGAVEVTITGVMNGLTPNTTYTVYLANGYTPYVFTGWNVVGTWVLRLILGANWDHDIIINIQSNGTFSGTGGWPAGGPYIITETVTGTIDVMSGAVKIHSLYNTGYTYDAIGTIAPDGTMSGTWGNVGQGYGHPWHSTSGNAIKTHTGDDYYTGLFTKTVQPFPFTTEVDGSGSWHVNLRNSDFPGLGIYSLSVWINNGTILISDTFQVEVE